MKIKRTKKKNFVHVKSIYGAKDLKRRSVISATMIISVCWDDDDNAMEKWKRNQQKHKQIQNVQVH